MVDGKRVCFLICSILAVTLLVAALGIEVRVPGEIAHSRMYYKDSFSGNFTPYTLNGSILAGSGDNAWLDGNSLGPLIGKVATSTAVYGCCALNPEPGHIAENYECYPGYETNTFVVRNDSFFVGREPVYGQGASSYQCGWHLKEKEIFKSKVGEFILDAESGPDNTISVIANTKAGLVEINLLYADYSENFIGIGKYVDERLATSNESYLRFFEKQNGNDFHSYFVASYNGSNKGESYVLRAKISEDPYNGRNETSVEVKTPSGWWTVCQEKVEGDTCNVGDVVLLISDIEYQAGKNESMNVTAGSNVVFNKLYDKKGEAYVSLPSEDELPTRTYRLNITSFGQGYSSQEMITLMALNGTVTIEEVIGWGSGGGGSSGTTSIKTLPSPGF